MDSKPKCADLFCGAGGAAMGLHRAGFEVIGWDIKPQPHYPFEFHLGNAMDANLRGFDCAWASPPCQKYTRMNRGLLQSQGRAKDHQDLVAAVREKFSKWGGFYIIENVVGAPLLNPIMLCGSSFGLQVQRHRLFESNVMLLERPCTHGVYVKDKPALYGAQANKSRVVGCYGNGRGKGDNMKLWSEAMGIDWMTRKELAQAIPPAFSEYLGRMLMRVLKLEK